jgi:hypothetical protein
MKVRRRRTKPKPKKKKERKRIIKEKEMEKGKKEIIDRQDIIDDGNGPEKRKRKMGGKDSITAKAAGPVYLSLDLIHRVEFIIRNKDRLEIQERY